MCFIIFQDIELQNFEVNSFLTQILWFCVIGFCFSLNDEESMKILSLISLRIWWNIRKKNNGYRTIYEKYFQKLFFKIVIKNTFHSLKLTKFNESYAGY